MNGFGVGRIACTALLLSAACDVTVPWRSGSDPDVPSSFEAVADSPSYIDGVVLRWSAQGGLDGFELEGRVPGGRWEPLGKAPPHVRSLYVELAPSTPEATRLTFRVRARAGSRTSSWTEATYLRGVRPPSSVTVDVATFLGWPTGPATIRWTNESQAATDIQIERSTPSGWVPLVGATLAAGAHVDHLVQDGVRPFYRVRVGTGGIWSEPCAGTSASAVALAAPWGLEAEVVTSGVQLTWTNQSTTATSASVTAWLSDPWDGRTVAMDGVPSAAFDPTQPVWPATRYHVDVSSGSARARSNFASLPPFTVPGPPALAASSVLLPAIGSVARSSEGGFHVVDSSSSPRRIHRALPGGGHESHLLPDGGLVPPSIASDEDGHPHAVLTVRVGYLLVDVVHERWNGGAWDADTILTSASADQLVFALGSAGALHLVYEPAAGGPLVHVLRAGGVTTAEEVPATSAPPDFSAYWPNALAVGPDGTAYIAQSGRSPTDGVPLLVVSTRSPEGTWSDETLPLDATLLCLSLAPGAGGDLAVAFCRNHPFDDVQVIERRLGAWSSAETVLTAPSSGYGFYLAFAGAPDLSRLVLSVGDNGQPTALLVRGDAGWQRVQVGPDSAHAFLGAGASGAWALFRHRDHAGSSVPTPFAYSSFQEVP
jgi:hypothetical protein